MNMVMLFDAELSRMKMVIEKETRADPSLKKYTSLVDLIQKQDYWKELTPMTSFGYKGMQKRFDK